MSSTKNWLPGTRAGQLAMAQVWANTCLAKATAWGIPKEPIAQLATLSVAAGNALAAAQDEATRTPVATAKCKAAFDALVACMRDFKRRYFLTPPLAAADLVSLGLPTHDETQTVVPPPTAQPTADVSFPGIHLVELGHIRPVTVHSPDEKSDYGIRIHYGFTGAATRVYEFRLAERPELGSQLPYSAFTRRGRHRFDFEGESGNTMYLCMRYENAKGEPGPFGPFMQFVVP